MHIYELYSALGDEITYRIAILLAQYRLSVGELVGALDLKQPHVSHKLAKLRKYGCVAAVREGRQVFYEMRRPCKSIVIAGEDRWKEMHPGCEAIWADDIKRLNAAVKDIANRRH